MLHTVPVPDAAVNMVRIRTFLLARPRSVVCAVAVATLLFAWQARHVRINNSMSEFFPAGHPAITQDEEVKALFDTRESLLIGILREDGVFRPSTLQKVRSISDAIWDITVADDDDLVSLRDWANRLPTPLRLRLNTMGEGGLTEDDRGPLANLLLDLGAAPTEDAALVAFLKTLELKLSPVQDVVSLSEVENVTGSADGLAVEPPMRTVPTTDAESLELAREIMANDMFLDGLVARDGVGTVILAELAFHYDHHIAIAHEVFRRLNAIIEPFRGPETIVVAGVPMVNVYMMRYMSGDLTRLTPLVVFVVFTALYALFGSLRAAVSPMVVVLVSVVWTLGLMGALGRSITLVVSAMPVMLIAIGVADGVHIVSEYRSRRARGEAAADAILATMEQLTLPIVLTSFTTIAGFLSLATSRLETIRDFGLFTAFGVFVAMIVSLTVIPAILMLFPLPEGVDSNARKRVQALIAGAVRGAEFCVGRRHAVLAAALILSLGAAGMLTKLKVGSMMVGYFRDDNEIVQASAIMNQHFGGTEVLDIVIDTKLPDGLKNPRVLGKIADLQDSLEALPTVGYTTSLADYIRRINYVMNDGGPEFDRIPGYRETGEPPGSGEWRDDSTLSEYAANGRKLIAQYLMLYESVGGEDLSALADYEYQKAHILVQIRTDETPLLRDVRSVADKFAERNFTDANVYYAGCSNLCIVADELIIPSQLKSLAVAVLVVFVMLTVSFRSLLLGMLGLLPLVITLLATFALMATFGVHLDSVTAVVASIVLGIGVDYSVHLLSRYKRLRRDGAAVEDAIRTTLRTTGSAIVVNASTVAIGFTVLVFSSFWPIVHVGWLVAVNMIASALIATVVVPALLLVRPEL